VCLDVAGLAANLYRRNTGIIKVRWGVWLTAQLLYMQALPGVPA
jgi:hypothetical protein